MPMLCLYCLTHCLTVLCDYNNITNPSPIAINRNFCLQSWITLQFLYWMIDCLIHIISIHKFLDTASFMRYRICLLLFSVLLFLFRYTVCILQCPVTQQKSVRSGMMALIVQKGLKTSNTPIKHATVLWYPSWIEKLGHALVSWEIYLVHYSHSKIWGSISMIQSVLRFAKYWPIGP